MSCSRSLLFGFLFLAAVSGASAQIFGPNLVVNGGAETDGATAVLTPGWTTTGTARVLTYAAGEPLNPTAGHLVPLNRGRNYIAGGGQSDPTQLAQTVDLSSAAALIDRGMVSSVLSAYLGGTGSSTASAIYNSGAQLIASFKDASGTEILTASVVGHADEIPGLRYRRTISVVPPGTRSILLTLTFLDGDELRRGGGLADELSLTLSVRPAADTVLGRNLVINGDAESGPASAVDVITSDIPGWQRERLSVGAYDDSNGIRPIVVGSSTAGSNFFVGGRAPAAISQSFQEIDVSAASNLIDAGQLTYTLSALLGAVSVGESSSIRISFRGWGEGLGQGGTLQGPQAGQQRAKEMLLRTTTGAIPRGTRVITVELSFEASTLTPQGPYGLADDISLRLTNTGITSDAPVVSTVVTAGAFGGFETITPGTWIEIYGTNLATTTRGWSGTDFNGSTPPWRLDGTSVTVGGGVIPVSFISPTQVNAYVPICCYAGPAFTSIVVSTPKGNSAEFLAAVRTPLPGLLAPPAFGISGRQYVVALHQDGTYVLPEGAIAGVSSRPAKPGETITMYGIGFGPVTPEVNDAQPVSQSNRLMMPLELSFGASAGTVQYDGLSPGSIGLYQFNVVVPAVGAGDAVELGVRVGGKSGEQRLFTAVRP